MRKLTPVLLSSLAIMLGACSSSDDDNIGQSNGSNNEAVTDISCSKQGNITTVKIDASTQTAFLNLSKCQAKSKTQQWDLAFNRANILVNASAKSAIADEQAEYYNGGNPASNVQPVANNGQQFANATNATELDSLLNATSIIGNWINDGTAPAIDGGWYVSGHPLVPTDQNYVIRSAEGNTFARMKANNITFTGRAYEVEFAFYIQGETDQQFANSAMYWTVTSGADACYDFDIPDEVNCSEAGWDMKFVGSERMMPIYTNGGVSGDGNGAAYKMDDPNEYNSGRGTGAPTDTNAIPPMAYEQDKPAGAFSSYSWYAYDPLNDGTHQLLPNYRVYVVDTQTPGSTIEGGWYTPAHPLQANGQAYVLRSAEGNSFAKMTFKEADTSYNLTFNFEVQSSSDSSFNTTAIEWNTDLQDSQCFDFDGNTKTSCDNAIWDIKLASEGRSITLTANGGLNSTGGNAAIYTVPQSETVTGVDTNDQPEWQMLEPYKLQITDYYNDSGASGHISLRYLPLSQTATNNQ